MSEINPKREPVFLFQMENGELIYVSRDQKQKSYQSYKLFKGLPSHMNEIPIDVRKEDQDIIHSPIEIFRDGGTINIFTLAGLLHRPAPHKNDPASWITFDQTRSDLTPLDPSKFNILELNDHVQISPINRN